MFSVAIIGYGRMGAALKTILPTEHTMVAVWDTDQTKVAHEQNLCNIIGAAQIIFLCIPSNEVKKCAANLRPDINAGSIVVSLSKGLDPQTQQSMHEVLAESLPNVPHATLGGPMLSAEIERGLPARGMAGTDLQTFKVLEDLFAPTRLSLIRDKDVQGIAMAGVLKNVYALGLGIADALGLGDNARGWLIQQATHEMAHLLPKLGGEATTAYSLAGLGDLIATGTSQHSRNHTAGQELVEQGKITTQSEGFISLPLLVARLKETSSTPFLDAIRQMVLEARDPKSTFQAFAQTR